MTNKKTEKGDRRMETGIPKLENQMTNYKQNPNNKYQMTNKCPNPKDQKRADS